MSARDDYPPNEWDRSALWNAMADEIDRLRGYNNRLRTELARWGWGDFHYGGDQPQDPVIVALLAEHGARKRSSNSDSAPGREVAS